MPDSKNFDDLTERMAEILPLMFYGEELEIPDPTQAAAEAMGESQSAIAAVVRHLVRRGWVDRTEEGLVPTEKARAWWATQEG